MSELSDKLSGKAKQAAGKASDDKQLQNQGKMEELRGTAKEKLSNIVDTVSDKVDDAKRKLNK